MNRCNACGFVMPGPLHKHDCAGYDAAQTYPAQPSLLERVFIAEAQANNPPPAQATEAQVTPIPPRRDPVVIGGDICADCMAGKHSRHVERLGDICIGCACGTLPHLAAQSAEPPTHSAPQDEAEALTVAMLMCDMGASDHSGCYPADHIRTALAAAKAQGLRDAAAFVEKHPASNAYGSPCHEIATALRALAAAPNQEKADE